MQERLGRARVVVVSRLQGEGEFAEDLLYRLELEALGRQSKRKHATGPDEVFNGRCVDGGVVKKYNTPARMHCPRKPRNEPVHCRKKTMKEDDPVR